MSRDVNIHVKAKGAKRAQQDIEGVGRSTREFGEKTDQAGRKGAAGLEKASGKMNEYGPDYVRPERQRPGLYRGLGGP